MKTALLLCLGSLVFSGLSTAQISLRQSPPGAVNSAAAITRIARGAEIPNFLGSKMAQVAARHGRTEEQLRELCRNNRHLRADAEGLLHFACEAPLPFEARAAALSVDGNGGSVLSGTVTQAEVMRLHSRPGCSRVIFLDFDGHSTTGTAWNSSTATSSITTPPYSTDATASTAFSQTELNNIYSIWQRVAEDYAPFDVDVTTQDPGVEGLRKSNASDAAFGVRICIGGSSSSWYGAGAGGVAYVGSFNWNSDTPAFVFSASLGSGNVKYTAEAISHETGHTLGLNHDGVINGSEYYAGHGNWAPIMGVGYSKEIVQWSKGDYTNASNKEDDVAVITSMLGRRADVAGDSLVDAKPMPSGAEVSADGVIETADDADLYAFNTAAGRVSFTVTPASPAPNLDTRLSLYDAQGTLLQFVEPTTLGASLSADLPQGTYYLAVEGVGAGAAASSYDDYGSLGQFSLRGSLGPVTGLAPVAQASVQDGGSSSGLAPFTVAFSSQGSSDSDGDIVAWHWDFGDGGTSTEANPTHLYTRVGRFTASLVVTDNSGLSSAAASTVIQVTSPRWIAVSGLQLSSSTHRRHGTQIRATLTVRDAMGALARNVLVRAQWSGLHQQALLGYTNNRGQIVFATPYFRVSGSVTFSVLGLERSGDSYDSSRNRTSSATAILR
jgi:PKD repeat protein